MKISIGKKLPDARLIISNPSGPDQVFLSDFTRGKKTVLIGMPGAFTSTCSNEHLPSVIRNAEKIRKFGIDEILCVVSNDIHVVKAWNIQTGASCAGVKILADPSSKFIKKTGLEFSAPDVGFYNRFQRVFIFIDNEIIKHIQLEQKRGSCNLTSGEKILSFFDKL